jgi:FixJ family two-component response regulator
LDGYNKTVLHKVAIQINNLPNMIDIFKLIIDSGADDYLAKPLEYQQTLDKIASLLGVKAKGASKK